MKALVFSLCLLSFVSTGFSNETAPEKVEAGMSTVKRKSKQMVHRTKEAVCGELTGDTKIECLAKKAKNNLEEGADAIKDKTGEVKNKVDSN